MKHTPLITTPGHGLSARGATVVVVVEVVVEDVVVGAQRRGAR
jgi:hypothetical protein